MVTPVTLAPVALSALGNTLSSSNAPATGDNAFGSVLGMVQQAMNAQQQAQQLTIAVAGGQDVPLHQVVQAISQAELTLQTLVTVRDKAVEAYQQIQQMPI